MELTEEPKNKTTYYIKLEIGRHVPEDNGFYAIFDHKEMSIGLDNLIKSVAIVHNVLQEYITKRLVDGVQNKES